MSSRTKSKKTSSSSPPPAPKRSKAEPSPKVTPEGTEEPPGDDVHLVCLERKDEDNITTAADSKYQHNKKETSTMSNSASATSSNSSCSSGSPTQKKKSWPPQNADKKPFPVGDFDVPIDVELTEIEFLSVDDPGFFTIYASNPEIHMALGIPGAPVAQGATPALSAAAFKAFVVAEFGAVCDMNTCGVARLAPGLGNSDAAFQRLSNAEAEDLINRQAAHFIWGGTVAATPGAGTGLLYEMTPSSGGAAGGGRSPQAQQTRRLACIAPPS